MLELLCNHNCQFGGAKYLARKVLSGHFAKTEDNENGSSE